MQESVNPFSKCSFIKDKTCGEIVSSLSLSVNSLAVKIHELRLELLPPPPYSPDLAPSKYALKNLICRQRFESNEELFVL